MLKGKTLSYLALGDSYTIGESVPSSSNFPSQLCSAVSKHGVPLAVSRIIAKTGWTSSQLLEVVGPMPRSSHRFELVTLLIGVNDQFDGISTQQYAKNFRMLAEIALLLASNRPSHVAIFSIPDYAYTPFGQKNNPKHISREIDRFNEINRTISTELNLSYFDITQLSRKDPLDLNLVAADQLHPSEHMYALWAKEASNRIADLFLKA